MPLSHVLRRPRAPVPGRCRRDPARPDAIPCRSRAASAIGPAHLELDRGTYGRAHQGCLGLASCLHPHLVDTSKRNESIGAGPPKPAPDPQIPIARRATPAGPCLAAFGRRPSPSCAIAAGRHPKTFTTFRRLAGLSLCSKADVRQRRSMNVAGKLLLVHFKATFAGRTPSLRCLRSSATFSRTLSASPSRSRWP